jgi:hypothetical protein
MIKLNTSLTMKSELFLDTSKSSYIEDINFTFDDSVIGGVTIIVSRNYWGGGGKRKISEAFA